MEEEEIDRLAKAKAVSVEVLIATKLHNSVVRVPGQSLSDTMHNQTHWHTDEPCENEGEGLIVMLRFVPDVV